MKVVLFCGGRGIRLREHSEAIPKPMVQIGYRPILWHVMRYYAHYGHRDFILCLGYRADAIKDYFLHYEEARLQRLRAVRGRPPDRAARLATSHDWRITFADTGLDTTIGERLRRVRHLSTGEEHVPGQLRRHPHRRPARPARRDVPGATPSRRRSSPVRPATTRSASSRPTATGASAPRPPASTPTSGSTAGYFILRQEVFDVIEPGDELVEAPFGRLIDAGRLHATSLRGVLGAAGHAARRSSTSRR